MPSEALNIRFPDDLVNTPHASPNDSLNLSRISFGTMESSFASPVKPSPLASLPNDPPTPPTQPYNSVRRRGASRFAPELDDKTPVPNKTSREKDLLAVSDGEDTEAAMDTPVRERKLGSLYDTPALGRAKRTRSSLGGPGATTNGKTGLKPSLRDQEDHISNLNKECFALKLKVHFLEEKLHGIRLGEDIEKTHKQNTDLKVEVKLRGRELKRLKKLLLELEDELKQTQEGGIADELKQKLEEKNAELAALKRKLDAAQSRGQSSSSAATLAALQEENDVLLARQEELEEEVHNAKALLEETNEELERMQHLLEQREADESADDRVGKGRRARYEARLEELEAQLHESAQRERELEAGIRERDQQNEMLSDLNERMKAELKEIDRRREEAHIDRSASRVEAYEEREEREALEEEVNILRDKHAATQIALEQKTTQIEALQHEKESMIMDHERMVAEIDDEWRGELLEARGRSEEFQDVLSERENELKEKAERITELEATITELHEKFEHALAHVDRERDEKDSEIESANREIERLAERVWALEEELEESIARLDEIRGDAEERERVAKEVSSTLKEKLATAKAQLTEMTAAYEQCREEILTHRTREDELARNVQDLCDELDAEREARGRTERENREQLERIEREWDEDAEKWRLEMEEKEQKWRKDRDDRDAAYRKAQAELASARTQLNQRTADLESARKSLHALESESRKLGESHTTDRFSLELELDRLRRDLARCEDDLKRARNELADKEAKVRDRESALDRLHVEHRDLATKLATQTQAKINVSEKLDSAQASLKVSEAELASQRTRISELEQRLSKDQRALLSTEHQYRDQLTERNTLLLTIYQYMDKILGVDKTPKKGTASETKPFTNFGVFHDNLITRLKALSQIQLDFDRRCKEAESRYGDKLAEVKKQLDFKWKQIDRFEASVKNLTEVKASWRRKYSAKEGELEAVKSSNTELSAQLTALKRTQHADSPTEIRALTARATIAERRATNAQNQLMQAEERMAALNERTSSSDGKWEARVKEYEMRLKAAEEKVKRERQGAKERVNELEASIRTLQRQIEHTNRRNQQLGEVLEANNAS